ncbi:MAG: glycosyltransferase [Acidobacteriota bacterium]|nr:glycosyltransferase [Acidobacteriota bacterium]
MPNKNLLLVSYSFPPFGGVGVHRALSLAAFLPASGWNVHVLTARNPAAVGSDPELLKQIPDSVTVHRTLTLDLPFALRKSLKRFFPGESAPAAAQRAREEEPDFSLRSWLIQRTKDFLSPDPQVLWLPFAIRAARRIVAREAIDVVIVTVPPYSSLEIGIAIKKRFPHIVLVSDFRDEWLTYYFHTLSFNKSPYALARATRIERDCIEASGRVVAVTENARSEMRKRYPDQPPGKFLVNSNGYEPQLFRDFKSRPGLSSKVTLGYTGTVYAPADPTIFVQALKLLPAGLRARLLIRFIGHVENPAYRTMLQSEPELIALEGFLPRNQAMAELETMDFLLLIWNDTINIPGKFYDYLGTGKPIIAFIHPDSEVNRILTKTRAGWWADGRDPSQIAALLTSACGEKNGLLEEYAPDRDEIRRYERPRRAAEYSALLESALRESRGLNPET